MDQPLLMSSSLADLEAFLDVGNARMFRELSEHLDTCDNSLADYNDDQDYDEE